jgi:hypothetical protein
VFGSLRGEQANPSGFVLLSNTLLFSHLFPTVLLSFVNRFELKDLPLTDIFWFRFAAVALALIRFLCCISRECENRLRRWRACDHFLQSTLTSRECESVFKSTSVFFFLLSTEGLATRAFTC